MNNTFAVFNVNWIMKHYLMCSALLGCITVKAQLPANSYAPDFTISAHQSWLSGGGMHGNGTYSLYQYLDSGYTVILDVSATWCGPCFAYHTSGQLEQLYAEHGPAGEPGVSASTTDDVVVFWVDADYLTDDASMTVNSASWNWIEPSPGEFIQYPMANIPTADAAAFNDAYGINYYPTIYKICPNRIVNEVGQLSAAALYAGVASCPAPATDTLDAALFSYDGDVYFCSGSSITPVVTIQNYGFDTLIDATVTITQNSVVISTGSYTGSLSTYALASVTCSTINAPALGPVEVTITSPGDTALANNVIDTAFYHFTAATSPLVQSFSSLAPFPYLYYQVSSPTNENWVRHPNGMLMFECYMFSSGTTSSFVVEPVDLSTLSDPSMSFDVAYIGYTPPPDPSENDTLEVFVSTDCGDTWTSVYRKFGDGLSTGPPEDIPFVPAMASDWRNEVVPLSQFAGQTEVVVKFVATSDFGNNMYLDNINIGVMVGIDEIAAARVSVFPNPAVTDVSIAFDGKGGDYKISITDMVGRTVANELVPDANVATVVSMPVSELQPGQYVVTVSNGRNSYNRKLTIQ